ncbi:MAG: hypothetical protein AB7D00_04435 [Rhodospirillaceae bacterium]
MAASDWRFLAAAPSWLSHAAVLRPPAAGGALWRAIGDARFDAAMAAATAAFDLGDDTVSEEMGLLARIAKDERIAGEFFRFSPQPDARAWRNRGVAALWAHRWDAAAAAFSAGSGDGADGRWCRESLGLMLVLARRWAEAEALLGPPGEAEAEGLGPVAHLCRMAASWGLGREDLGPDLDPAVLLSPGAAAPNAGSGLPGRRVGGDLILFLACDPGYFDRHGLAALASFAHAHRGLRLGAHLHLYDPTPQVRAQAEQAAAVLGVDLVLTGEAAPAEADPARRGAYCACARFCRLSEALPAYDAPVLALDADALVRHALTPLLARVPHAALALSPLSVPWNRHPAGFLLVRPGAAGAAFLSDAARLIGDSLGRGRRLWFLDQWALLLAAERHAARLRLLPWRCVYDTGFGPRSWVWQANDARKADPLYRAEAERLRRSATATAG